MVRSSQLMTLVAPICLTPFVREHNRRGASSEQIECITLRVGLSRADVDEALSEDAFDDLINADQRAV